MTLDEFEAKAGHIDGIPERNSEHVSLLTVWSMMVYNKARNVQSSLFRSCIQCRDTHRLQYERQIRTLL